MFERMRARAVHHPVIVYFILAYALSWSICALLIADHNGLVTVPGGLHYLVSFGPALAALIVTALLIGVFWALWHLPEFFYKPNFIALVMGGFLGFAIGVIAGSVLLTWLYNRSGSSILVVALWHAVFDFTTATSAAEGTIAARTSVFVMVWAIVVGVMAIWRPNKGLLLPTAAVQANNGG